MAQIIIAASAVTAKLHNPTKDMKSAVQEVLSYKTDARTATAFADGPWSGRSSFYDWQTDTFPAGFLSIVMARLQQLGHTVRLVRKPLPTPLGPEKPIVDAFGYTDARYDYQPDVVRRLERYGQIIAQVATGGGKSRIAKMAYRRIARPTMFLTTRGVLMHQMAAAVRAMGESVGVMGDGQWSPGDGFNVAMVQTLIARLKEPAPTESEGAMMTKYREIEATKELLRRFELVILEEAHESSSYGYSEIMRLCTSAYYRLALTATPFMSANEEANMRLMAASGPVAIKVSEKQLIDCGILARPIFKFIRLDDATPDGFVREYDMKNHETGRLLPCKLNRGTPWPKCYEVGITHGVKRNGIIVYEAQRAARMGLSVLILVQAQAHGKKLQSMLTEAGLRCNFIFGDHEQDEREAALNALKSGKLQVLIGSKILDVGVDVPALGMVIIASAGKAEVGTRQRIGRGLRAKKTGPNVCYIVEFDDWQSNYLRDHSKQRRAIIESTPGFVENILPAGSDYDFAGDGFIARAA